MAKYRIILNPASGRGTGGKLRTTIEEMLTNHGLEFDLIETNQRWHAVDLARKAVADGYEVVVAAGGDGTSNEVLNGLMQATHAGEGNAAMGFICVGQGNDYAFGIGVTPDLEEACRILAADNRKIVDVGFSKGGDYPEGRYFGNGVGIGFDAVVGFEALKLRPLQGFLSYLIAALKTILVFHRGPRVKIQYNENAFEQRSLMVSVMNGTRLGGGFMMAPEGVIDDGQFDLSIVDQVGRLRIAALIPYFIKGTHATQPEVKTDRTSKIVVTALEGVIPAHADGETLCEAGEELSIEILPKALEVITPIGVSSE
jgi:YegS/Rv2252/BmrU family lipid kinase